VKLKDSNRIELLETTIESQQNQIKQCIGLINDWAMWSVTVNKNMESMNDKITYLEKALRIDMGMKCLSCFGFGLHTDKRPMDQMDALHGMRSIPCPECGRSVGN